MPQLDVCTFASQYSWTVLIVVVWYLCSVIGLRGVGQILHLRK